MEEYNRNSSHIPKDGTPIRILIVEDEEFLRDVIHEKLEEAGYKVWSVGDGLEGIETVKKERIQLVLLDLLIPGIDGFEVLRRLKWDKETSSIPVIIFSNLGQKEDVDRALGLGAEDYLIKAHFTPDELLAKVNGIVRKTYRGGP